MDKMSKTFTLERDTIEIGQFDSRYNSVYVHVSGYMNVAVLNQTELQELIEHLNTLVVK